MARYRIEFEVEIPDGVSESDIEDFMEFELGAICSLSGDNELCNKDLGSLDVTDVSVWRY